MTNESKRQLLIIGGAEDKVGDCIILREFVRRAGGTKANIVIMTAATEQPAIIGFGIDENTAMAITGDQFEVIGEGVITVVDESELVHNNVDEILKDEPLAFCGAKLHILPHGYKFDLKTHKPILDGRSVVNSVENEVTTVG